MRLVWLHILSLGILVLPAMAELSPEMHSDLVETLYDVRNRSGTASVRVPPELVPDRTPPEPTNYGPQRLSLKKSVKPTCRLLSVFLNPFRTLRRAMITLPLLAPAAAMVASDQLENWREAEGKVLLMQSPIYNATPEEKLAMSRAWLVKHREALKGLGNDINGNFSNWINDHLARDDEKQDWTHVHKGSGIGASTVIAQRRFLNERTAEKVDTALETFHQNAVYLQTNEPFVDAKGKAFQTWEEVFDAGVPKFHQFLIAEKPTDKFSQPTDWEEAFRRAAVNNAQDLSTRQFPDFSSSNVAKQTLVKIATSLKLPHFLERFEAVSQDLGKLPPVELEAILAELFRQKVEALRANATRFQLQGFATRDGDPLSTHQTVSELVGGKWKNFDHPWWEDFKTTPVMMHEGPAARRELVQKSFARNPQAVTPLLVNILKLDPGKVQALARKSGHTVPFQTPQDLFTGLFTRMRKGETNALAPFDASLEDLVEIAWQKNAKSRPRINAETFLNEVIWKENLGSVPWFLLHDKRYLEPHPAPRLPTEIPSWERKLKTQARQHPAVLKIVELAKAKGFQIRFDGQALEKLRNDHPSGQVILGVGGGTLWGQHQKEFLFPENVKVGEFFSDLNLIEELRKGDANDLTMSQISRGLLTAFLNYLEITDAAKKPLSQKELLELLKTARDRNAFRL